MAALALGGVLLAAAPALAVQPTSLSVVTSADPVNYTPNVLDGEVRAVAEVGTITIVGGTFTQVEAAGSKTVVTVQNIFAFNSATGAILTTFNAKAASTVYALEPSGDGTTVYVGGQFANISGVSHTKRLARINVTTGAVDTTFVSPGFDGIIKNVKLRNGLLYVGGTFLTAGSGTRDLLAAVDPSTGALSDKVNLTFASPRNGGALQVIAFDITPNGNELYAIGNFTTVNGLSRYQIVKLDLSGATATVADWQTTKFTTACSSSFDTYMRDIDISDDGSYFIIGTTGAYSGGPAAGTLCDSDSRWETGQTGSNQQPTWVDYTGGDTTWSVMAGGSAVYVGGHFRWFNNPYASDKAGQGAVARAGVAALDPRNGLPLSWNPGRTRGVGVFDLVSTSRGLYMGSDTDSAGGETHGRIALFPAAGGAKLPDDYTGTLPGTVYSLGDNLGDTVKARSFDGTTVSASSAPSTGGTAFSTVRGAFMVDGKVYYGTSSGTLIVRSFDGTTWGTASTVNLNNLTDFATDLKSITGMFYDARTGRLYYTMSGSTSLYYRYFTSQSQVVGAQRFTAQASITGLSFSSVSSMFQSGSYLYVASSTDGSLKRYTWNSASGTVSADGTVVGSGQNWKARGAFVYAAANGSNVAPAASFTSSNSGLQVSVDASASSDPDGSIASVAWGYGDGTTGTGTTATHIYAAAGTYTITLTVKDDDGATATTTQPVTVTAPATAIAYRAGAASDGNSKLVPVTVPSAVQAGDTLVMVATANSSDVTLTTPSGWTVAKALTGSSIQSTVLTKVATAADAGATVKVALSAAAKLNVQVLAYSGSASASVTAAGSLESATVAAHTTPGVPVATSGSYVVSYWADKSTDTTGWTTPGGLTSRVTSVGTGSGHITSVTADLSSAAGTAGGLTATASSANSKAVMWSLVIAP